MSLPLLRLLQGAEKIDAGLQDLSPDLARVLLDYLFGPKYIQVIRDPDRGPGQRRRRIW